MTNLIIYPTDDGGINVIFPCECGLTVAEIARKDVPANKPYLLISPSDLPAPQYRSAWTADFSEPDGYGIGPDAWFAERAAQENS